MDRQAAAELLNEVTTDDRRDMGRLPPAKQLDGNLYLQVDDETLDIIQLRDVSPFGLGLESSHAVAPGVFASLIYEIERDRFQIDGIVLWAKTLPRQSEDNHFIGHYQLGLKLAPGNVAANLRFYRHVTNR